MSNKGSGNMLFDNEERRLQREHEDFLHGYKDDDKDKIKKFMIEEKQVYFIESESMDAAREEFDCMSLEAKDKISKSSIVLVEEL